jgi:ABC-2 type transport system permease protein
VVAAVIRTKLAVLRHSATGPRAAATATGGIVGLLLAAAVLAVAAGGPPVTAPLSAERASDLLAVALAVWTLGWFVGPVLFGGGDESLRPEHFALLPLGRRRITAALGLAAFVGVAPTVTLVALGSLVVLAARSGHGAGALAVAVAAALAQLVATVITSRLVTAAANQVMGSRAGAGAAGVVSAALLAATHSAWVLAPVAGTMTRDGLPDTVAAGLRAAPSGWGLAAVEAAGRGDLRGVLAALGGLVALAVAAWWVWSFLVGRRLTAPRVRRATGRAGGAGRRARGPVGAVVARELRTWSRDRLRVHLACFAVCYALVLCLLPVAVGSWVFVPWTGLVLAVWLAAVSSNLYGDDGTELWVKLTVPGGLSHDVRGRQLAWLVVTAPPALVLSVGGVVASGQGWAVVWLAALLPAVLGGGSGVVTLASVLRPVPLPDPHRRGGNLLQNGVDFTQVLVVLALTAVSALPAALAAARGPGWAAPVVGVTTGAVLAWSLGGLAARRLEATAPELLLALRTGTRGPRPAPSAPRRPGHRRLPPVRPGGRPAGAPPVRDVLARVGLDRAPAGRRLYVLVTLTVCWVPLAAQGVVPAALLRAGVGADDVEPSWFLALHVPPHLAWPAVAAMVVLGLALLVSGLAVGWQYLRQTRRG